jgi:dipeptidase E
MKLFLSSYKFSDREKELLTIAPKKTIGYIPNARDFTTTDPSRRAAHVTQEVEHLKSLGFQVEIIELRDYFHKQSNLEVKVKSLSALFLCGGNVFILRQALALSGLDILSQELRKDPDFLWAGYSAGCCVLSKNLSKYAVVDNIYDFPYRQIQEPVTEGLGVLDFMFMPHWKSNHPESHLIDIAIADCVKDKVAYYPIKDGDVLIAQTPLNGVVALSDIS